MKITIVKLAISAVLVASHAEFLSKEGQEIQVVKEGRSDDRTGAKTKER